jgi:hypothetical protein
VRYQVLDPNFSKGNLGGNLITVIDGIAVVNMTPQQASYWITQGAVLPLSKAGQINYQMASRGLAVGSPIFDVPIENVKLLAENFDSASPAIDAPVLGQTHVLAAARFATASPSIDVPVAVRTYPWLPLLNGEVPTAFADFRTGNCLLHSIAYNNPASWLTALAGTYSRAGPATYLDRGILKTAAANVARFPTDLAGNPLGIRLTESATNQLINSNVVASPGAVQNVTGPDGVANSAWTWPSGIGSTNGNAWTASNTTTRPTTGSVFVKQGTSPTFNFGFYDNAVGWVCLIGGTWTNGVLSASAGIGNPTIVISPPLANGWYRLDITATPAVAGDSFSLLFYPETSGGGTGLNTLVYGFQVTDTAFGVDYIPTTTVPVTQASDDFHFPWTSQTFSAMVETTGIKLGSGATRLLGSTSGSAPIYVNSENPNAIGSFNINDGVITTGPVPGVFSTQHKSMVAGSSSGRSIVLDAGTVASDANALWDAANVNMYMGSNEGGADFGCGNYEQLTIWGSIVASNAEMQRLTKLPIVAVGLTTATPVIDVVSTNSWLPLLNGAQPTIYSDFVGKHYWSGVLVYDSFAGWLAALGGTFSRSSPATYFDRGVLKTAAANTPRFPTDINGNPRGIRLTGLATNIQLHSGIDSVWAGQGATVTLNAASDPSGGSAAASLLPTTANGVHNAYYPPGINGYVLGQTYTTSLFIKPFGPNTYPVVLDPDNTLTNYATFNLSGGGSVNSNVGNGVGTIFPLADGWFLIVVTGTAAAAGNVNSALAGWNIGTNSRNFAGDGVSGWQFWGWQITNTNFLCDYIPTTTATATQAADIISNIPYTFGSMATILGGWQQFLGNPANSVRVINTDTNASGFAPDTVVFPNGSVNGIIQRAGMNQGALSWDATTYSDAVNGVAGVDNASGAPGTFAGIAIGKYGSATYGQPNTGVTRIGVWNVRASAAQLAGLVP